MIDSTPPPYIRRSIAEWRGKYGLVSQGLEEFDWTGLEGGLLVGVVYVVLGLGEDSAHSGSADIAWHTGDNLHHEVP